MSTLSEQRAAEWPSLRLGLVGAAVLAALVLAAWAHEAAGRKEPSRFAQTEQCLTHEKLLAVAPATHDPIAETASGGALVTRVEGNGVRILIARSRREAEELAAAYTRVAGDLVGRLEVRGANVHLWERPASPTQRQTLFDCVY